MQERGLARSERFVGICEPIDPTLKASTMFNRVVKLRQKHPNWARMPPLETKSIKK